MIQEHNENIDLFEMPHDVRKAFFDEIRGVFDDGTRDPYVSDYEDDELEAFNKEGGLEVTEQLYEEIEGYINRHADPKKQRRGRNDGEEEEDHVSTNQGEQLNFSSDDPEIL